ncbi:MAG: helix-turn-helix domain-containing protein [Clostridiales bacterium]|nr:helix-turn-helix domain-containing protein [Clostridiales bacterium]
MNKVYTFIKQIAKQKGVRIEELHKKCGIGRTNMYYIIKGESIPSPDLLDKLADALLLTAGEKEELAHYYRLSDAKETDREILEDIRNLIYSGKEKTKEVELSYHSEQLGGSRLLRSLDDICDELSESSQKNSPGFFFQVNIINCAHIDQIRPMEKLISRLSSAIDIQIEHLIRFSVDSLQENVFLLKAILPLLRFKGYSCYYANSEKKPLANEFFNHIMIIHYGHERETRYMLLAFSADSYSDCYCFSDDNLYKLLIKNFNLAKKNYGNALIREHSLDYITTLALDMESSGDHCIINPSPCYNRIPIEIYQEMIQKFEDRQFLAIYPYLGRNTGSVEEAKAIIETILLQMEKRIELSYLHKQIDILTKAGLESFAKTGKLSDHYSFLPAFSKSARKRILEYIKTRHNDGKYTFYLVDEIMPGPAFAISKEKGVYVAFIEEGDGYPSAHCLLEHDLLTRLFADFAEKYVPDYLAKSEKEAFTFIDYLIESYCSEVSGTWY